MGSDDGVEPTAEDTTGEVEERTGDEEPVDGSKPGPAVVPAPVGEAGAKIKAMFKS